MVIFFILGLVLGGFAVEFALENVTPVTVTFFSWQFHGSLALVLLLAMLAGFVVSLLFVLPESIKNYWKRNTLKKENKRLEEELRKQKELTTFAHVTSPSASEISHLEQSATVHREEGNTV